MVVFSGESGQTGRAKLRFLFRFQNSNSKHRIKRNRGFFNSRIISQNLCKKFYAICVMSKPEWQSSEYTTLAALSTLSWWRASSCTSVLIPKPMRKAPLKSATCRPPMCILLQNLQMLSHKLSSVRHYTISCVRRRSPGPSEVSRSLSFFFVRARPSAY
ncbi:hypothetical protein METSCH_D03430 [Metschnikowia aff. pulcherrima]|uniref:Uncharacterized protein n=1 Tax=Metschnikowia aff. pulcherrima TaxID=2163413 RepID=A0A4P6XSC3_9ASCO|nr:hypothetical protein METSCH_D03430 [Metschnikowia aff. pulcherrima]